MIARATRRGAPSNACGRDRHDGYTCELWRAPQQCEALGTAYEELQWAGWRRWTSWLLWYAWHDDRARLGLASDCLPEPHAGETRAPSRADFRGYACTVLAQAYGAGCYDELAARWRPLWSAWLNGSASTWSDNLLLATRFADWIYRRKKFEAPANPGVARKLEPTLVERAASGDELAARVLGWLNDACLRAMREHACCDDNETWFGYSPRCLESFSPPLRLTVPQ